MSTTKPAPNAPKKPDDKKTAAEELSEEDLQLKDQIEYLADKITSETESVGEKAKYVDQLFTEIKVSSASRTALPKQLKFLKPRFNAVVAFYQTLDPASELAKKMSDMLSFGSITLADTYDRDSLKYLRKGTGTLQPEALGDEFVLNLAGDLAIDYDEQFSDEQSPIAAEIHQMSLALLPFMFKHGHEINAVDLLSEIERLDLLHGFLDSQNYLRIFSYLLSSVEYSSDNVEFSDVLENLFKMAIEKNDFTNALRVALRANDIKKVHTILETCKDRAVLRQLAFQLGRHRLFLQMDQIHSDPQFTSIASNELLSKFFLELQRDLDVLPPKKPNDIYKNMLESKDQKIDVALLNLADSFVNGFVNLGSLKETLIIEGEEQKKETTNTISNSNANQPDNKLWIQRVKESGIMSTVASLGLVYMWNFEDCSSVLSDYFDLKDGYAKAGACIALGLSCSGVWNENDPAKAMLEDAVGSDDPIMKLGSAIGLGLAYAASARNDLKQLFENLINDENLPAEVIACSALSLGLVFVSEGDEDVSNTLLTNLMVFTKETLDKPLSKFLGVAMGLNFLGQQRKVEAVVEALKSVEHPIGALSELIAEICAYVGSGNVLKVQEYMNRASKVSEDPNEIELQCVSLLGIALLSISEPVGTTMLIRFVHQILHYSDIALKRVVPIMLAIVGVVNFNIQITDLLYKLAHDEDTEMALRALLALGVIGAGTNNSRVASLLRSLASYYESENHFVYVIKVALGLLHAGKGLVGINPYYSDGFLYSKTGYAALIVLAFSMLHTEDFLVKNNHYLIYYLSLAINPKMLFFLDEDLKEVKVSVRVGQAVDTVGQVGKPRKITGFQTHTSPVVINLGERFAKKS